MSGFFQEGRERCRSLFCVEQGQDKTAVRCNHAIGHEGKHHGRSGAGIFLRWTDAEARESRRVVAKERVGALEGWRVWKLDYAYPGEYRLRSTAAMTRWEGPVMTTAKCKRTGELCRVLPEVNVGLGHNIQDFHPGYDHGVFCYKTPQLLYRSGMIQTGYILGRLDVTGHVVEHTLGYRAQIVTIRELWLTYMEDHNSCVSKPQEAKAEFERVYQCPVTVFELKGEVNERHEMIRAWAKYYTQPEEENDG